MTTSNPSPLPLGARRSVLVGAWSSAQAWLLQPSNSIVRFYLPLSLVYLTTRALLYAAGLRMNLDLRWMFLSDPAELRSHLLRTVFYFHAFAPGTNLLTGVLLKLVPEHVAGWATAIFWAFGFLMAASLARLLEAVGLKRASAFSIALAFSLLPQSLYLEHLYLYTYLCTALLCLMIVLFRCALSMSSTRAWAACFAMGTVLGWLYTTFHLFWLALSVLAGFALAAPGTRRKVLFGAAAPLLLLFALYAKNYAVFGVFGATSWGGGNLTLTTTRRMPPALRNEWIREGKISAFAALSVFEPPERYLPYISVPPHYPWPGTNEFQKPSLGTPNYNHGLFLDVNRQRRADAVYYIRERPLDYLATVLGHNVPELFSSTTHWHPSDQEPEGPHFEHRRILGGYEEMYDRLVHGFPVPPVGLYVFLPIVCAWTVRAIWRGLRAGNVRDRTRAALLAFCLFQVVFVLGISCLFTAQESARYRYAVEPCIWVLTAAALGAASSYVRQRRAGT